MRPPDDTVLLRDMRDHARKALAATQGRVRADLERDEILAAALERFIEVIGEAAGRVQRDTRESLPGVPWREVIGMRDRLIHGYAAVDHDIVWAVVTGDLPDLLASLDGWLGE